MSLGGLIAGALGGAAKGYTEYAGTELKKQQELDLRKQLMEAETEKQLRIDEIKRNRDIADIPRRTQAEADAAPIKARGDAAAAPILAQAEADTAPIRAKGAAAAQVAKTNTPGYTESLRKESLAKHIESAGSLAQAQLANLSIDEKREVQGLIKEYDAPNTSDARRAQITKSLTVRGIIKPGEFDTEKVTTESMDPETGAVTKTERTQRRTTGASGGAQFKVGETREVQSGPNKGKTVEWDGKGWKLKE